MLDQCILFTARAGSSNLNAAALTAHQPLNVITFERGCIELVYRAGHAWASACNENNERAKPFKTTKHKTMRQNKTKCTEVMHGQARATKTMRKSNSKCTEVMRGQARATKSMRKSKTKCTEQVMRGQAHLIETLAKGRTKHVEHVMRGHACSLSRPHLHSRAHAKIFTRTGTCSRTEARTCVRVCMCVCLCVSRW